MTEKDFKDPRDDILYFDRMMSTRDRLEIMYNKSRVLAALKESIEETKNKNINNMILQADPKELSGDDEWCTKQIKDIEEFNPVSTKELSEIFDRLKKYGVKL